MRYSVLIVMLIIQLYVLCLVTQSCLTFCNAMDCSLPGSSVHGDSSGKNIGVGCHAFLQRIFPTWGLNLGLPHCRWILYHLSQQGSPWILEWIAYHFSRGASWWRNQTRVFSIASGFLTSWATRETLIRNNNYYNIIENIPSVSCKYFLGELSH